MGVYIYKCTDFVDTYPDLPQLDLTELPHQRQLTMNPPSKLICDISVARLRSALLDLHIKCGESNSATGFFYVKEYLYKTLCGDFSLSHTSSKRF